MSKHRKDFESDEKYEEYKADLKLIRQQNKEKLRMTRCKPTVESILQDFEAVRIAITSDVKKKHLLKMLNGFEKRLKHKFHIKKVEPDRVYAINRGWNVTDEFKKFFKLSDEQTVSRPFAMRLVWSYIKEHRLQHNKENGREFTIDQKLAKLFHVEKGIKLTLFDLQKMLTPHFISIVPAPLKEIAKVYDEITDSDGGLTLGEVIDTDLSDTSDGEEVVTEIFE